MKKNPSIPIVLLSVVLLSACSDNSKRNDELLNMVSEGLENSTNSINISTATVLHKLENKLNDYKTKDKAEIWLPITKLITAYTNDLFIYLKGLKTKETLDKQKISELYAKLITYRSNVFDIDPSIRKTFEGNLILFSRAFDTKANQVGFYNIFFKDISHEASLAVLNRLQNNIKIIENSIARFCNEHVGSTIDVIDVFEPLVSQNSTILKAGEFLTISAFMSGFNISQQPQVSIGGIFIPMNPNGLAIYKMKVPNSPGKHLIPVRIKFFDQTGLEQIRNYDVGYTVAKECDQE